MEPATTSEAEAQRAALAAAGSALEPFGFELPPEMDDDGDPMDEVYRLMETAGSERRRR